MIKRIHSVLRTRGVSGILELLQQRVFRPTLACFDQFAPDFEDKIGLEIGGPSGVFERRGLFPLYPLAARIDNCNFSEVTVWEGNIRKGATFHYDRRRAPGTQHVAEATDLGFAATGSYDFVLSSHALEHVANPLRAVGECKRVLKDHGMLVLVLPCRDGTFDHRRPLTTLSHLIADFERDMGEEDLTHLDEILALHDLTMDPEAGDRAAFEARSMRNIENRCLHHHVFDPRLAVELVDHMGLQILALETHAPFHIFVVARKTGRDTRFRNAEFIRVRAAPPQT